MDIAVELPRAGREARPVQRSLLAYLAGTLLAVAAVLTALNVVRAPTLQLASASQLSASQILFPPVPSSFPLVTDGSRLYFNDWVSGRLGLRQMLVAGGEAVRLESPFDDAEILINPQGITRDGSDLVMTAFKPGKRELPSLWLWPLLEGPPRQIGSAGAAAYSPDGSQIVFTNIKGELLIAGPDLKNSRVLAGLPGRIFWPSFSPDGERIRFSFGRGDGLPNTLWEVSLADGAVEQLLPDWTSRSHCCGSWTPDGKHFVFQAIDNGRSQIWVSADSGGLFNSGFGDPYQLTRGPIDFRRATIAPSGDRLFAIGWQLRGEIVQFDSQTEQFVAVPELDSVSAEWLAYSADRVAYVSYPDATLWIGNSDGTDPQQLSFGPLRVLNPVWSPDGGTIAFEGLAPGREKRIFLVSTDTRQIVEAGAGDARQVSPSWSPDGRQLAYNERGKERIQLLDVQSGEVSELASSEGLYAPSWSRAGAMIAARGEDGLVLFDTETGEQELIVEEIPIERHYWDGASEHVFFYEPFWRADARTLFKVNIHTKDIEQVAIVGDVRSTYGIGGMWIGPGPDDAPVLLRDLSIHHIYALDVSTD